MLIKNKLFTISNISNISKQINKGDLIMITERKRILNLLADKKITEEEAGKLLDAFEKNNINDYSEKIEEESNVKSKKNAKEKTKPISEDKKIPTTSEMKFIGITKLNFAGIGELELIQCDEESLSIDTKPNALQKIEVSFNDGCLNIKEPKVSIMDAIFKSKNKTKTKYTLKFKNLEKIKFDGMGKLLNNSLACKDLNLTISGMGDFNFNDIAVENLKILFTGKGNCIIKYLSCGNFLDAELKGMGNLEISGKTREQKVTLSGFGNYGGRNLESNKADVILTKMGNISVNVKDFLKAEMNGMGNIDYVGSPKTDFNKKGMGKIQKVD